MVVAVGLGRGAMVLVVLMVVVMRMVIVVIVVMPMAVVVVGMKQVSVMVGFIWVPEPGPPDLEHPEADAEDEETCHNAEIAVQLLVGKVIRRELGQNTEHDDAERMGEGNREAEDQCIQVAPL